MTRQELLDLCLTFPDTYEDAPFDDPNWTVVRHRANRKCFAMLFEREGKLCINLKCEPMQAEFFRRVYVGVTPGYHMNKEHWNTVLPDSDVPTDTFYAMIQESYDRTRPKTHRVRKETPHEWETMQRAKMYIHKLAGGIDPLTDRPLPEDTVLNQPRLARCFSYVEILIERAMQQEIRSVKARRKNLPPFFLTPEQKQKVLLVHEPIPISKFAEALNAAA